MSRRSLTPHARFALGSLAFSIFLLFALYPLGEAAHVSNAAGLTNTTFFDLATRQWCARAALVSFAIAVVGLTLASALGYFFSRRRSQTLDRSPLPQLLPGVILLAPIAFLILRFGAGGAALWTGAIFLVIALPFFSWQMKRRYDAIPPAVEEAAALDGCPSWQKFYSILWPANAAALCWTFVCSFLGAWNIFLAASLLRWNANLFPLPHRWGFSPISFGEQWAFYATGAFAISLAIACVLLLLGRSGNSEPLEQRYS